MDNNILEKYYPLFLLSEKNRKEMLYFRFLQWCYSLRIQNFDILIFQTNHSIKTLSIGNHMKNRTGKCIHMIRIRIRSESEHNTALHMVSNVDSLIVLTLTMVEKQGTAFPRLKLVAHISGGLSLLMSKDIYKLLEKC